MIRQCTLPAIVVLSCLFPGVRAQDQVEIPAIISDVIDAPIRHVSLERLTSPDEFFSGRSQHHGHDRRGLADKHAPAGLMGGHVHGQGEWMVEYKYMNMYMDDNKIGSNKVGGDITDITVDGILTNELATPTSMTMEMHMIHLMYGLNENVTLYTMLMLPSLTMDHLRDRPFPPALDLAEVPFTTHNSGFGDTTFGALVKLWEDEDDEFILNVGGSVPTGTINRATGIPTGGAVIQQLPYPMRLGSGTFNAKPGMTWKHFEDHGSCGVQFQTDIPIGRNYRGYSVSDVFTLNTWYSHLVTDNLALSFRAENIWKTNYDGADAGTPDNIISTNVEAFRGGYTLNLGLGIMALIEGQLFNVEFVPTVYQDVSGIQLENDWSVIASWSTTIR